MITSFFKPKTRSSRSKDPSSVEEPSAKRAREDEEPKQDDAVETVKRPKQPTLPTGSEVEELLSYINDSDTTASTSWKKAMKRQFSSAAFGSLARFVARERASKTIYPPARNTFGSLNMTPLDQVRVVIVGQDPYHGPSQAHGLCFSVLPGNVVPPSLKNIYKELREDLSIEFPQDPPKHGHLERWAKQGVLMLNTVMTVRRGEPNSHKKRGWEAVTDDILRAVDQHSQESGKGVVFLLWGKPAAAKAQAFVAKKQHTVITTSHPSPLGARKTNQPFLGSKCFSRCNQALKELGHPEIDWNVDGEI